MKGSTKLFVTFCLPAGIAQLLLLFAGFWAVWQWEWWSIPVAGIVSVAMYLIEAVMQPVAGSMRATLRMERLAREKMEASESDSRRAKPEPKRGRANKNAVHVITWWPDQIQPSKTTQKQA